MRAIQTEPVAIARRLALALMLSLPARAFCAPAPGTLSDVLIVLESDARSHTVQHTLATDDTLITLTLPGSVIPYMVRFLGPERLTFDTAYRHTPNRLSLWSGSAFVRYHHQYGEEVVSSGPDSYTLRADSRPASVVLEHGELAESSITWVFPTEFEITSWTATSPETGNWIVEDNTLTFRHSGPETVSLGIEFRRRAETDNTPVDLCASGRAPVDACAPDTDVDGVPDYRDICVADGGTAVSDLGCQETRSLVLTDIVFAAGQSYLDASARALLNRVAMAMQKTPGRFFEISAHTDSRGTAARNQALSEKRADAVRHYLLLRGVDPNQVRARGYGESFPLRSNESAAGRQANRRVELTVLN